MIIHRSTNVIQIRNFALLLGAALFIWLPFEDTNEIIPIIFAYLISAWLVAVFLIQNKYRSPHLIYSIILAGILSGAVITPLIFLLIAFKTGLHAHSVPDYSNEHTISIFRRTPIWMISGFFIGTGLGILVNNLKIRPEPSCAAER